MVRPGVDTERKPAKSFIVLLHAQFPEENTACHSGPLRARTWIHHMAEGRKCKSRARRLFLGLGNLSNSRGLLESGAVLGCLTLGLRAIMVCA